MQLTILQPVGETYLELVRVSTLYCESALLVVHEQEEVGPIARAVLDTLEPALLRRERAASWPGTTLLEDVATIRTYQLTQPVLETLQGAATGLFDWQQPDLPEDLCLLRDDGDAWLTTIAHDEDAFLRVEPGELEDLRRLAPHLAAQLRLEEEPLA